MAIVDVQVPQFSESVSEGTLLTWKKKPGEAVTVDETLVEIETDKVVLEVPAPATGVLAEIIKGDGSTCWPRSTPKARPALPHPPPPPRSPLPPRPPLLRLPPLPRAATRATWPCPPPPRSWPRRACPPPTWPAPARMAV
jgi:Biotin-requiring enzyme